MDALRDLVRGARARPLPAPPLVVALYLSAWAREGPAVASLAQALAAISEAHAVAGYESSRKAPDLREVWKGTRRAASLRSSSTSSGSCAPSSSPIVGSADAIARC